MGRRNRNRRSRWKMRNKTKKAKREPKGDGKKKRRAIYIIENQDQDQDQDQITRHEKKKEPVQSNTIWTMKSESTENNFITSTQNQDHHSPVALPLPGTAQLQQHRGMNGPPDMFTHSGPGSYASLDAFQSRLGELQNTLNESMAKWNREGDPNQEIPHHEGLGL